MFAVVKHFCHKDESNNHERCLIKIYSRYFELVSKLCMNARANEFYFQAFHDLKRFVLKNCVVGIHSLNGILPSLCAAIRTERKTSHRLCVTCVSKLFNASVEEKLIRNRSGHVSDALLGYKKSCADQELKVSNVLNPPQVSNQAVEVALDISSQQVNSKCTSASSSGTNDAEEFLIGFDEFDSTFALMDEEQVEQMCSKKSLDWIKIIHVIFIQPHSSLLISKPSPASGPVIHYYHVTEKKHSHWLIL